MGGVVGLGVGLAATTVVGPAAVPAAAGVGAYVGAFAGALGKMEDSPAQEHPLAEEQPDIRHAGFVVAAHAPGDQQRARALEVLQSSGAKDIETAEGQWRDGKWTDFDPVAAPGTEGKPVAASAAEK